MRWMLSPIARVKVWCGVLTGWLFWGYALISAQQFGDKIDSLIKLGLTYAYQESFPKSDSTFQAVITLIPERPEGYFFKTALRQLNMFDEGSEELKEEFYQYHHLTLNRALCQNDDFYQGASYLYRAVFEGWRKNYWSALHFGLKARRLLKNSLKKNPQPNGAHLGLGLIEYFRARASRYLTGLSLFGSVNKGIEEIKRATADRYFDVTAAYALSYLLVQEKQFVTAESILHNLLSRYPKNRTFLRLLRDLYFYSHSFEQSIKIGEELLEIYKRYPKKVSPISENQLILARAYYALGNKEKAKENLLAILRVKKGNGYIRLADYQEEAREYLRRWRL